MITDPDNPLDMLYLRIWDINGKDFLAILEYFRQRIITGGLLVLEIIRFSGFTAYPYHYSFSRTVDLIAQLETDKVLPEEWLELLKQNGFNVQDRVHSSLAFLSHPHNRIISHCLEAFKNDILKESSASEEELEALIPSLKQFEDQKDTLICRPGVHLILAKKI